MIALDQLRTHVEFLLRQNAYDSCCFLATKLVTLSNHAPQDVFILARAYQSSDQPSRAVDLLEKHGLLASATDPNFLNYVLLACQCCSRSSRPDEVIKVSDLALNSEPSDFMDYKTGCIERWGSEYSSVLALICIERGKAYRTHENRKKMLLWMTLALFFDVRCTEALDHIVNAQLTPVSESALLRSLLQSGAFVPPEAGWLLPIYECSLARYDCTIPSDNKFEKVERMASIVGGPSLREDIDVLALKAEARFNQRDARGAFELTKRVFELDPGNNQRAILVHIAAMVELGMTSDSFYFAHKYVKENPRKAISWYAVGSYYYSAKKFDISRRFFAKATTLDSSLLAAWIALAHAHAMHDESDRAMAIYRTTARLFPGSHSPVIGTAMEYLRTNNVALAEQFCQQALTLCDADPAVYNELGVVLYRMKRFAEATECFEQALKKSSGLTERVLSISFESVSFNLGHALRRAGSLQDAILAYKGALSRSPKSPSGHAALGLTYHLNNQPELAVESYHVSLGLRPGETLVEELMELALKDISETLCM